MNNEFIQHMVDNRQRLAGRDPKDNPWVIRHHGTIVERCVDQEAALQRLVVLQSNSIWEATRKHGWEIVNEGKVPDDADPEDKKVQKLTEKDDEIEDDPSGVAEPEPKEHDEVAKPDDGAEPSPEGEGQDESTDKEYIGKTEDRHFYMTSMAGETEESPSDMQIVDQNGEVLMSTKDVEIDVSDPADFILHAIQELEIDEITRSVLVKHILPKFEEEDEEQQEELESEDLNQELEGGEKPDETIPGGEEEGRPFESRKFGKMKIKEGVVKKPAKVNEGVSQDDIDRFKEIMQEMSELVNEAYEIARAGGKSIEDRAQSYWRGHIQGAIGESYSEYLGGSMYSMEDTLGELEGEPSDEGDEDDMDDDDESDVEEGKVPNDSDPEDKKVQMLTESGNYWRQQLIKHLEGRGADLSDEEKKLLKLAKSNKFPVCRGDGRDAWVTVPEAKVKANEARLQPDHYVAQDGKTIVDGYDEAGVFELNEAGKICVLHEYAVISPDASGKWVVLINSSVHTGNEGKVPDDADAEDTKIKKLTETNVRMGDDEFEVFQVDEETDDTVISINGHVYRFDKEFAAMWRDEASGELTEDGLRELALDALSNMDDDEYGDVVATARDQSEDETEDRAGERDRIPASESKVNERGSACTKKEKRQVKHIEKGEKKAGKSAKKAKQIAHATMTKQKNESKVTEREWKNRIRLDSVTVGGKTIEDLTFGDGEVSDEEVHKLGKAVHDVVYDQVENWEDDELADNVRDIVDQLEDVNDVDEFDSIMGELYNFGDGAGILIQTMKESKDGPKNERRKTTWKMKESKKIVGPKSTRDMDLLKSLLGMGKE